MVKRILLLALVSSRTAARQSVLRRRSVQRKDHSAAAGRSVSRSFNRSVWVTGEGSVTLGREAGNIHFYLVSTLLFWVIISQVGIENPTDLIDPEKLIFPWAIKS